MNKYFNSVYDSEDFNILEIIDYALDFSLHLEIKEGMKTGKKPIPEKHAKYLTPSYRKAISPIDTDRPPHGVSKYLKFDWITKDEAKYFLLGFEFGDEATIDKLVRYDNFHFSAMEKDFNHCANVVSHPDFYKYYSEKEEEIEIAFRNLVIIVCLGKGDIERNFREYQNLINRSLKGRDELTPIEWIQWALEKDLKIPWLEYAKEQFPELLKDINITQSDRTLANTGREITNKSLGENDEKEIATQSKARDLIRALATLHYPNKEPHNLATTIEKDIAKLGVIISAPTIRKYLKEK